MGVSLVLDFSRASSRGARTRGEPGSQRRWTLGAASCGAARIVNVESEATTRVWWW